MISRTVTILCFALFLFSACEQEDFAPQVGSAGSQLVESPNQAMQQMLRLVNDLRSQGCRCGSNYMPPVGRLSWNYDLEDAALRHANDMYTNDFFDHTGSDGSDASKRIADTGYNWQAVGENIAWGYQDAAAVFDGWKNSPGHCRNMMSPHFQHMGSAQIGKYWVQEFARPKGN